MSQDSSDFAKKKAAKLLSELKFDNTPTAEPVSLPVLPDSFFDGDKRTINQGDRERIRMARLDLLQSEVNHQWEIIKDLTGQVEILRQEAQTDRNRIARLESQIAHLTWMTHDIDPIVEANGSDRYANNWLPKPNWLQRWIAGWGKNQ